MSRLGVFASLLICSALLILRGCSAEAAHEVKPQNVASLVSLLKAKIPATLQQATKDYQVARSIFDSATKYRSKGTELYSKGFDMRRRALLKAKALVHSLAQAGLGADSRAAVRDLNTIRSLARRIAAIATDPHPPRNSKLLLDHLSETAAQARNRFHSYNHELDDSMLAHPDGHFTQILFHAEMLCARGKVFKTLADSEDASGMKLKRKARSLALQVKSAQHRIQLLSGEPSAKIPSPGAKKIISLARHESQKDSTVINYLLHEDKNPVLTDSRRDSVNSLVSDLRKQDALVARDERRHLDVDVDYGKAPRRHFTLADSLVKFSHRLAESDTSSGESETASPIKAHSPIALGTDSGNRAALELAREFSPDDQVDLAAGDSD